MAYTPPTVIKTSVRRCQSYFSRYACRAEIYSGNGGLDAQTFYGTDGRKVRAEATEWVCRMAEQFAKLYETAWQDPRDSKRAPYGR